MSGVWFIYARATRHDGDRSEGVDRVAGAKRKLVTDRGVRRRIVVVSKPPLSIEGRYAYSYNCVAPADVRRM
jgi:hypothetical protein